MSPEQRLRRLEQQGRFAEIAECASRAGIDPYELEVSLNEIEALIAQLGSFEAAEEQMAAEFGVPVEQLRRETAEWDVLGRAA